MTFERDQGVIDTIRKGRARMVCNKCGDKGIVFAITKEKKPCWCDKCKVVTHQIYMENYKKKEEKK